MAISFGKRLILSSARTAQELMRRFGSNATHRRACLGRRACPRMGKIGPLIVPHARRGGAKISRWGRSGSAQLPERRRGAPRAPANAQVRGARGPEPSNRAGRRRAPRVCCRPPPPAAAFERWGTSAVGRSGSKVDARGRPGRVLRDARGARPGAVEGAAWTRDARRAAPAAGAARPRPASRRRNRIPPFRTRGGPSAHCLRRDGACARPGARRRGIEWRWRNVILSSRGGGGGDLYIAIDGSASALSLRSPRLLRKNNSRNNKVKDRRCFTRTIEAAGPRQL